MFHSRTVKIFSNNNHAFEEFHPVYTVLIASFKSTWVCLFFLGTVKGFPFYFERNKMKECVDLPSTQPLPQGLYSKNGGRINLQPSPCTVVSEVKVNRANNNNDNNNGLDS